MEFAIDLADFAIDAVQNTRNIVEVGDKLILDFNLKYDFFFFKVYL